MYIYICIYICVCVRIYSICFSEKVDFLYDICRADFALFRDSPFCAVFSDSNLKVLEYNEDLKFYWRDTHPLSANISCPLIKDIMQTLR